MTDLIKSFAGPIADYRKWLSKSAGAQYAKNWDHRLHDQPEPAIVEACVQCLFASHVHEVVPCEDPSSGGPDFRCYVDAQSFYLEATCLTVDAVTAATKLPPHVTTPVGHSVHYSLLTRLVMRACIHKASQLSKPTDAPALLAVGTLHFQAGARCIRKPLIQAILTSTPKLAFDFDAKAGEAVGEGFQLVDFADSAFIKTPEEDSVGREYELVRQSISGVLVCGFGGIPVRVLGILHPDARRPFDHRLLPQISFCRVVEPKTPGKLVVEWLNE